VHDVVPPGAKVVAEQVTATGPEGATCTSVTAKPDSVTLPVFSSANVYVTTCPTDETVAGAADLASDNDAFDSAVTVAGDGSDVTLGPDGGVPDAVAESTIDPASISACVTVYDPVHVVDPPGANVVTGHDTDTAVAGAVATSATDTPVNVTLPVLRTMKV